MDENALAHQQRLNECVAQPHEYPAARFKGRGIVICAGGVRYFTNAYVCASILRMHGCTLPIQFWHLGPDEMTDEMRELVRHLDVECVDGYAVREQYPARILNGWELKPFAIIHSPFEEVIALDADNVALRDPACLFDTKEYRDTGAIFWPDFGRLAPTRSIWKIVDVPYRDEPEFESGQIVVDKRRCWKALQVTMHINEYSDFYYSHIHGDKETFHLAWRKINQAYAMPARGIHALHDTMCQHDFDGNRLFQHRNLRKWQLRGANQPIADFYLEFECLQFVYELRQRWSIAVSPTSQQALDCRAAIAKQGTYKYCRVGFDFREITFRVDGTIDAGQNACEQTWRVEDKDGLRLVIYQGDYPLCYLSPGGGGHWHGQWLAHEKMPVVLLPTDSSAHTQAQPVFREHTWDHAIWNSVTSGNEYLFADDDPRCPWVGDVIDVGGHIGAFSYLAAHKLRARKIVVVEPDPENFATLSHNLADLIASGRVVALHAGLGPENSRLGLRAKPTENTGGLAYTPTETGTIPTVTLAHLLTLVSGPVLLKLDCEGCEYEALESCADISPITSVIGEFHSTVDKPEPRLRHYFESRGYLCSFTLTGSGNGLFSASKS